MWSVANVFARQCKYVLFRSNAVSSQILNSMTNCYASSENKDRSATSRLPSIGLRIFYYNQDKLFSKKCHTLLPKIHNSCHMIKLNTIPFVNPPFPPVAWAPSMEYAITLTLHYTGHTAGAYKIHDLVGNFLRPTLHLCSMSQECHTCM